LRKTLGETMEQIFVLGSLIASIVLTVKGFKKFKIKEFKKGFKQIGIGIGCFLIIIISIGIFASIQDKQDKVKAAELAKYHASPEYKAKVAKEKADAEAKAKADTIKKQQEEAKKKEQIKQDILKNIVPDLKDYAKGYDDNWNQIWKPTMNYLSQGGTDIVPAYQNLQTLKSNYDSYQTGINLQPVDGSDDSDKKLIDDYNTNMKAAFYGREDAVGKAMDMLNTGEFRPASVTAFQQEIQTADSIMVKATADEITLLTKYGIDPSVVTK
jgi:hypothetical protein